MAANTQGTSTKRASDSRSGAKKTTARKPAAKKSGTRAARSTSSASRASSNGAKRSTSRSTRSTASSNGNGVVDTVKHAAGKAAGPAVAVGAAAVGIAGGIALKTRTRRKTVLGVKMPRSIGRSLPDIDAKSIAKSVGHASKQFAKTTKSVSKDLERAGDQAERIGKILD
jgi:hypothetical protein